MAVEGLIYPVGLVVRGRPCLVVGGGAVAGRKAAGLLACGAAVTMVAPEVHGALALLAAVGAIAGVDGHPLDVQVRPYEPGEAGRYRLVVTATDDASVNRQVHDDAEAAGVWVNSADDPDNCSFILPAVWRRGPVSLAVSSGGASPALAGWLRRRMAASVPSGIEDLAELLAEARRRVQQSGRSTESVDWQALLEGPLPDLVGQGRLDDARELLAQATKALK